MITYQLRLPICKRCGKLHTHFLEYAYSALCPTCRDQWIVETFVTSPAGQKMSDRQALDFLQQRRPELFAHGTLPDYLSPARNHAKDIAHE